MRDDMREAIGETVQGLVNLGLPTTFTKKQLDELAACRRDRGLRQESPWRWLAKAPVRRFGRSAGRT